MASLLSYSQCTPFDYKSQTYNIFKSKYKNLRYSLSPASVYKLQADDLANLPGLSFKLFGSTDYWRILLDYNGLYDPLNDLYPGLVLNVPSRSDLLTLLSSKDESIKKSFTF